MIKGGEILLLTKVKLTKTEIEKDIIYALKHPADRTKKKYRILRLIGIAVGIAFGILAACFRDYAGGILFAVFFLALIGGLVYRIHRNHLIKNVSIYDYDIRTSFVKHTYYDHYRKRVGKHSFRMVDVYVIVFEKDKEWSIPKEAYLWSETNLMSDITVYETAERGDTMIIVTERKSGKIVMAYNEKYFEYQA